METVSDGFFLALAEISSALTGLFLVGIVLYIQVGYDKSERSRAVVEPYMRAATSITFIAYAIPVVVPLTLVSLPIAWSRWLYYGLVLGLVVVNVSTVATVRRVQREMKLRLLVMIEVVGTVAVALMLVLPLATGGFTLTRDDLVPGLLLSLGVAFLGTWVLVLTLFDIAGYELSQPTSAASGDAGVADQEEGPRRGPARTGDPPAQQPRPTKPRAE
jgi:hypothetical protein